MKTNIVAWSARRSQSFTLGGQLKMWYVPLTPNSNTRPTPYTIIDTCFGGSFRVTATSAMRPATETSAATPCDQPRKSGFERESSGGFIDTTQHTASERLRCN